MRGNQIGLLNYLLGFGGQMPGQPGQPPASQGGPMQRQPQGNGWGSMPGGQYGQAGGQGGMGGMMQALMGAGGQAMGGGPRGLSLSNQGMQGQPSGGFMRGQSPTGMSAANGWGPSGMMPGGGGYGFQMGGQGGGMGAGAGGGSGGIISGLHGGAQTGGLDQMMGAASNQLGYQVRGGNPAGQMPQGPANNPMLQRMESYFGPLGTPTTGLQQQSLGGMSQFLNSDPYGQSNQALHHIMGGSQFGGSNGMYGQAAHGFGDVKNANYFGNAQHQFQDVAGMNPFGAAQTSMEGILGANPGQGMLAALQPSFDRNLAAANQQGGRFGSANAILRSRAVDDYNLLGAQALQRGTDQQIAAAGQYGVLGNNLLNARLGAGQGMLGVGQGQLSQGLGAAQGLSGVAGGLGANAANLMQGQLGAAGQMANNQNSMFGNMMGAYGMGSAQAGQEAQRQQQALQILLGQLGVSQQATLGAPTVVSPSGAQQGAQMGGDIGSILANYFANQQGGGKQRGNRTQGMG